MVRYRNVRIPLDRSLVWGSLLAAIVLLGALYITVGTEWGWNVQFFRWLVGLSILLFIALVATRRRRLIVPAGLALVGVVVFWSGTAGGACVQPTVPQDAVWGVQYDWRSNALFFGWSGGPYQGYFCFSRPNRLLALLGYLFCASGVTGLVRRRG